MAISTNSKFRPGHSFRVRAFLSVFLTGCAALAAVTAVLVFSVRSTMIQQKLSELRYTCSMTAGRLEGDTLSEAIESSDRQELDWVAEYTGGRMLLVDYQYRILYDSYDLLEGKYAVSSEIIRQFGGEDYSSYESAAQVLECTLPVRTRVGMSTGDSTITGVMVVRAGASWLQNSFNNLRQQITLIAAAGVMILLAVSFIVSGALSRPWERLLATFRKVSEGDLSENPEMEGGYTETDQILVVFGKILERLRLLNESRQEFVSNVSHELKTPITSMRVLADSLLADPAAPVDIYREFMGDISSEIDRETKIINDLLSLVRLDRSNADLNIAPVNINRLIEQILNRIRPIARQRNIEIIFESFRPVTAEVDETKLSLALTNLVENGIKYNNDGGWVRVSLNADHKYFFVRVADSGVGIPEDAREKIFERFYRVDKARSRETGGTGLGLAITRSVILLHHGSIRVDGKLGEGSIFTVRIPLKYIP